VVELSRLSCHPIRQTNIRGLEYFYIEQGQGETIFLLHGFPDHAGSWDNVITELSKNYRCIAPFLRGYYPTSMASDGDYTMRSISMDIQALADTLGIPRFAVIGHDWGASVTYSLANLCPERVSKIVTVAIPHPAYIKPNFTALYKARHFLRFRNENKSPAFTRKKNFRYLDVLYKRWAPNWKDFEKTSVLMKELFQMEGRLEAALGYYWSFHRTLGDKELQSFYAQLPQMPLLAFAGKSDGALLLKPFLQMEQTMKTSGVEVAIHEHAGHFLHQEAHDFFVERVLAFLR